jgi:NADH-quinone oxidoreductase subunit L
MTTTFAFLLAGASCAPLLASLLLAALGRRLPRQGDWLALGLALLSWLGFSGVLVATWGTTDAFTAAFTWFQVGDAGLLVRLRVDVIGALMGWVVAFISLLVQVFSVSYLRGDPQYARYFALVNFFAFAMQALLLTENLLVIYFFWELVGFSSYTLISFWSGREAAVKAGRQAFLYNRAADLGFLAALLLLWAHYQTFNLSELRLALAAGPAGAWLTWVGLGLLLGAVGKSAQFPLSGWLLGAMQGPTPVSALIHAATMVAAGVYLLIRADFLLTQAVLDSALVVGALTALGGALAASSQVDIKKVLAYSTISQLGYMVMAVGAGAPLAAFFHLLAHAFFKALLFLAAGSVIHHLAHRPGPSPDPQDMRHMGGLAKELPLVFGTYTLAALSLAGVPLLSGFLSKELVLDNLWTAARGHPIGWAVGPAALLTVGLTAFYIARQWFLVFISPSRAGEPTLAQVLAHRDTPQVPVHAHLSAWEALPLGVLAFLVPFWAFAPQPFAASGAWILARLTGPGEIVMAHPWLAPVSLGLVVAGFGLAWRLYGRARRPVVIHRPEDAAKATYRAAYDFLYLDTLYHYLVRCPGQLAQTHLHWQGLDHFYEHFLAKKTIWLARWLRRLDQRAVDGVVHWAGIGTVVAGHLSAWADRYLVDGLVRSVGTLVGRAGQAAQQTQSGQVQHYFGLAVGGLAVLGLLFYWWA